MPLHSSVMSYLEAVKKCGSIRSAARKLNVSSSSINRHVLALEEEYGLKLFERLGKGVRLTEAGEIVLNHVSRTLKGYDGALAELESLKGLGRGKVSIATVPSIGTTLLPSIIANFHKEVPGIQFDIITTTSAKVRDLIAKDAVDVGFTFNIAPWFGVREVMGIDLELGCIMSTDHSLARMDKLTFEDCLQNKLILPSKTLSIRDIIDRVLQQRDFSTQILIESDSMAVINQMVATGIGISFQTKIGTEFALREHGLIFRAVNDLNEHKDRFAVLISDQRNATLPTQRFVEHFSPELLNSLA